MSLNSLIRKMKSNILIRRLSWPYMTVKKQITQAQYMRSLEPEKLKKLKGIHEGKRCFIIGNGPSLTVEDLEALKNEITIASNRIYEIFDKSDWRPTYYIAEDVDGIAEMVSQINDTGIKKCIVPISAKKYITDVNNTYFGYWTSNKFVVNRYDDDTSHISEDISNYFSVGYTATFSAIQLAIYMGIKEIYLLGVDFNYSVVADRSGKMMRLDGVTTYFDGKERSGSYLNYYSTLYAYQHAKEYCDTHGIKISNATRGGKLEVFNRIDFDNIKLNRGGIVDI